MGNQFVAMEKEAVNANFNSKLKIFTPETADRIIFSLGNPSDVLLEVGIENKPLKLYGSKLLKKIKKHSFNAVDLMNFPKAIADPIAIFEGNRAGSFSILTEIVIDNNNIFAIIETGKGQDASFNVITSAYRKSNEQISNWINEGKMLYSNKEKALDYFNSPASIAGAQSNQEQTLAKQPRVRNM